MSQHSHILWAVIHANMRVILSEDDIKPPMELILDLLVPTHTRCECTYAGWPARDKLARFLACFGANLAFGFDHANTVQILPRIARCQA